MAPNVPGWSLLVLASLAAAGCGSQPDPLVLPYHLVPRAEIAGTFAESGPAITGVYAGRAVLVLECEDPACGADLVFTMYDIVGSEVRVYDRPSGEDGRASLRFGATFAGMDGAISVVDLTDREGIPTEVQEFVIRADLIVDDIASFSATPATGEVMWTYEGAVEVRCESAESLEPITTGWRAVELEGGAMIEVDCAGSGTRPVSP